MNIVRGNSALVTHGSYRVNTYNFKKIKLIVTDGRVGFIDQYSMSIVKEIYKNIA